MELLFFLLGVFAGFIFGRIAQARADVRALKSLIGKDQMS